ncbi:hypothetical protein NW752_009157 [Fusarium irregulare]|uniref:NACHT-NTPase and P-loop NTPases N-terminal domain-containing protein n=1 Tax=Fusarium irregulare TaxID=2494466 RepID=A0A9W8PJV2_9HYPO|nr:hypothetical protein NW766_008682 [Fusarium irregulare]KAJ4009982.1 hypothetical protein NW752_009157 [Fusarium irregulare]
MSGAEVLGIVSGAITLIEASIKLYKTAKDSSGLPTHLRDAATRLPLIQSSLQTAAERIKDEGSHVALEAVLQACSERAAQLYQIFEAMVPRSGATRTQRYAKAVRSFPEVDKANALVEAILADLQVITLNHVVQSSTRTGTRDPTSIGMQRESVVTFNNVGMGKQYVHTGQGDQNVASDTATQLNGSFNGGTFNFTQI